MARIVTKDPDLDTAYTVDWSNQLDGVTLSSSTWTLPTDLTEVTSSNTTTDTSVTLSGGTDGITYEITNNVTLSSGAQRDSQLYVSVTHDIISEPRNLPVQLNDVKHYLRVTGNHDDQLIEGLIRSAIEYVEKKAAIDLIDRTRTIHLPRFARWELDRFPVRAVGRIRYYDQDNVRQSLDATTYNVTTRSDGSTVVDLAVNQSWPSTTCRQDAVEMLLISGHGVTADSVPENAKLAIKMLCRHWYDHPGGLDGVPQTIDLLLASVNSGYYAHV